jgi:polyisoprenyl-teichoic acid--peptidoglycan teichoic acid transferase
MVKKTHSMDGFVPRRTERRVIGQASSKSVIGNARSEQSSAISSSRGFSKKDLEDSLSKIDTSLPKSQTKKGFFQRKSKLTRKQIIKRVTLAIAIILVLLGGWVGYRILKAGSNIFKGNILVGLTQSKALQQDVNGRSNILVLGTSEDDPGHGGAYLTDSMMIVSVNQKNKTVDMFSVPRDLYVKYGMACNSGYEGKINEYFNCVNDDWTSKDAEQERLTKTRKFVGDIFGLDIQYGVHVNNTVIKQAVDAVGGVDVDVQGSGGASGVLDRNFDWRCKYTCYLVKYDNGVHHLDGEHALFLAMARGDVAPTYGLGNSNFDREKNQQKIIIALKQKAVTTGTLADISKVTSLIDALGDNLRTNFEASEIRTLTQLGIDVSTANINRISLFGDDNAVVKTGAYNGASVVMPASGIFDYSGIQAFLKKQLSNNPITREGAKIVVLNGSTTVGVAQTEADKLVQKGLIVDEVSNAPAGTYADVEIYQVGDEKPKTKTKLEVMYGVKVKKTQPPVTVTSDTSFVIVLGKAQPVN